jgi:hypothetical protein
MYNGKPPETSQRPLPPPPPPPASRDDSWRQKILDQNRRDAENIRRDNLEFWLAMLLIL